MEFLKHMMRYFTNPPDPPDRVQRWLPTQNVSNLLPVYSENGCLTGFVEQSATLELVLNKNPIARISNPTSQGSKLGSASKGVSTGGAVQGASSAELAGFGSSAWDGWPDGFFDRDFTWLEFDESARLQTHWAVIVNGGDRKGRMDAEHWGGGKRSSRKCLGVIECDNPLCKVIIRPHTKRLRYQLEEPCKCGSLLFVKSCTVVSTLHSWLGGVHYSNGGYHLHRRPTHILHLLPNQLRRFEELVNSNPKSGPLQLVVGVPGLHGPRESAAEISPLLLNADRVSKERQKIVNNKGPSPDGLISAFSKFETDHPNFVIHSTIGKVTVISLQTPFMRSQLVRETRLDGPINGMVNDAAHGWWKEPNSLLMVSSTYCPDLHCWVPGVLSYTNGASLKHFAEHFLALFQSIAHEVENQNRTLTDHDFAGVMDFSQAEHAGFTSAFVLFWSSHPKDTRTQQELEVAAERVLKGCIEHFRAQVTRVGRIGGVIPPGRNEEFKKRALALLDAPSSSDFISHAELLVEDFPKIKPWISWWMRDSIAPMLFESRRTMDIALWNSLPMSTNAEESMHWKLYSACGRDHAFLEGMYSLFAVAVYFERIFLACLAGILIRYGDPEPWKAVALKHGRTKKHRGDPPEERRQKKSDGRPPDTAKELLKKPRVAKKGGIKNFVQIEEIPTEPSLYPWNRNSCWLDTSLQLLYVSLSTILTTVDQIVDGLAKNSVLKVILEHIKYRHHIDMSNPAGVLSLEADRNKIRTLLRKKKVIDSVTGYEPLLSWFIQLLQLEDISQSYRSIAAFEVQYIEIHTCTGTPRKIGGPHVQMSRVPLRGRTHQLSIVDHITFKGDFGLYFANLLSLDREPVSFKSCWRVRDGTPLCSGLHTSGGALVLSIPILLTFDIELEGTHLLSWSLPATLSIPTNGAHIDAVGSVYDLMGLALINKGRNHFIARYSSVDGTKVFTYDDRLNNYAPVVEHNASPSTHLSGSNIQVPVGFDIYQVFYRLRGGFKAQDHFYDARRDYISSHLNVDIRSESMASIPALKYCHKDFVPMASKDRTWMLNPFKASTTEYVPRFPSFDCLLDSGSDTTERDAVESEEEVDYQVGPYVPQVNGSSPGSEVSLPLSLFTLDCRCGIVGDGNQHYGAEVYGEAIQCDDCRSWSHIACQRNGRASALSLKELFICDTCDMTHILPRRRGSERKKIEARTGYKKPMHQRLKAGCGALARLGDYYYPVRLIQKVKAGWTVRWWRGNVFSSNDHWQSPISESSVVLVEDLRDSLWRDKVARRKIRLGQWTHACDVETSEDILSDPTRVPYTDTIDNILSPHKETLKHLTLHQFAHVDDSSVPSKRWLDASKKSPQDVVPFVGHLSLIERAQIANWFDRQITLGDPKLRLAWLGLLPLAHAFTIYIAHTLLQVSPSRKPTSRTTSRTTSAVMDDAWELQVSGMPSRSIDTDVDRECLYRLEEDMFEVSARAEMAGYYQWGLDAGHHEGNWDPYRQLPEGWIIDDHNFDEDHLKTGPAFIAYTGKPHTIPQKAVLKKPTPRRVTSRKTDFK